MQSVDVVIECDPPSSPRARQLEGMFDIPPRQRQRLAWSANLPIDEFDWHVGLIVGPSGSGKSTVARALFGSASVEPAFEWTAPCVVDEFPQEMGMHAIADICMAVGFNTIPAWLRPYSALSNGERFRVDLARRLAAPPAHSAPIVVDEFTSVVDRQVAQIASHAVQKHVRKSGKRFVAISCHYDVLDWLDPDWIFEPATGDFSRRSLRCRRPALEIEMGKVSRDLWELFAPYHYMTADLHSAAQCYALYVGDRPAVFGAMLYRPHPRAHNVWGLSRIVTLPDFQGLGLAFVLMDALGAAFAACGQRMRTYPAHPALIRGFDKSPRWSLCQAPGLRGNASATKLAGRGGFVFGGRPNATFEYCGGAEPDARAARALLNIRALNARESAQ